VHTSRGGRCRRASLVGLVGLLSLGGAACVPSSAPPPPPRTILIYGDSLTNQSKSFLTNALQKQAPGWRILVRSFGGTAICDYLQAMRDDGAQNAKVVVIEFSGNSLTNCMAGAPSHTQAWLDKYRADASTAASIWRARGAKVLFVGTPAGVCAPVPHPLDGVYRSVAASYGMTFSDAPERALTVTLQPAPVGSSAVTTGQAPAPVYAPGTAPEPSVQAQSGWPCATPDVPTDVFAFEMTCLPSEGAAQGCSNTTAADGTPQSVIQVRDGTAAAPGGHFPCPGHTGTGTAPCTTYSAGISRFAGAIATETLKLL
jgi:hypothetical protein